jgi:HEPN domain-containing protein
MSVRPEILQLAKQWVEAAEDDYRNAEHTLTLQDDCPVRTVCFHAQQVIEKYLKALLIICSIPFPKTHDLLHIISLLPKNIGIEFSFRDIDTVNHYAVEVRYPGHSEPVFRADAERAFEIAKKVRGQVKAVLPAI